MLYSVQHSGGRVAGHFELPETGLSNQEWVKRLGRELWSVLGVNAVKLSEMVTQDGPVERIVIDIDPLLEADQAIKAAHIAVGMVAINSELEEHPV